MPLEMVWSLPIDTQVFIGFILVIALGLHLRFSAKAVANGPTILTTLGIFATFFGIAMGLAKFDSANVQNSIPELLSGLKTAFWASVFGVGCALTLKIRDHLFGHRVDPLAMEGHDDVGAAEIVQGLSRVERALVGGEDGSLISQLKFLRTETRDELKQLREAQTKALEKLSEMGSRALIEALKDVIRDFNQNLTEQFGENFKHLNIAVGKLVEWQEGYRLQVEATTAKLQEIRDLLARATTDYGIVLDRSNSFANVADALGLTLRDMELRQEALRQQSALLAELLLKASGSLPEVERKVVELARQMATGLAENQRTLDAALKGHISSIEEGVRSTGEGIRRQSQEASQAIGQIAANANDQLAQAARSIHDRLAENQQAVAKALRENSEALAKSIRETVDVTFAATAEQNKRLIDASAKTQQELTSFAKDITKAVDAAQQGVTKSMTDGAESLRQSMRGSVDTIASANTEHNKQIAELISKTKESVTLLDKALGEELERSLNGLGGQLTALSQKFVEDYLPLTERLRHVVELAKRVG